MKHSEVLGQTTEGCAHVSGIPSRLHSGSVTRRFFPNPENFKEHNYFLTYISWRYTTVTTGLYDYIVSSVDFSDTFFAETVIN